MHKAQRGHVDVKSHIVWEGRPEGYCSCLDASLALDSEYILSQRNRINNDRAVLWDNTLMPCKDL